MGSEASNIENSQQLGTEGEEPCPGHRHSRRLVQDEHELRIDGRGCRRAAAGVSEA